MSRRPHQEHIQLHLSVPRGHDGFWSLIKEAAARQGTFTLRDISQRTNVHDATVLDYVRRLVKAGYLEVAGIEPTTGGAARRHHYRLLRTAREAPRLRRDGTELPETGQDTLWRTIKMLKAFTLDGLHAEVSASRSMPLVTVQRYLWHLAHVGILRRIPLDGKRVEYRLTRNVGGAAPKILRAHLVFDPNSNTVLGVPEAKEVA